MNDNLAQLPLRAGQPHQRRHPGQPVVVTADGRTWVDVREARTDAGVPTTAHAA
jgi:hypothetical protein